MVNKGKLKSFLVIVVLATIFFSMAPTLIYTMSVGVSDLLNMIVGNSTLFGSNVASLAGTIDDNWGYFLLISILGAVITILGGLFVMKRRGR